MKNFSFVFCDDMRRELSGKISFMGVFGPVTEVEGDGAFNFTAVCLIHVAYGSDLSNAGVALQLTIDGKEGELHSFPNIDPATIEERSKPERVTQIEKALNRPGLAAMLFGTIRIEGLKFKDSCIVRAFAEQQLVHEIVLVRSEFVDGTKAAPRKTKSPARRKRIEAE